MAVNLIWFENGFTDGFMCQFPWLHGLYCESGILIVLIKCRVISWSTSSNFIVITLYMVTPVNTILWNHLFKVTNTFHLLQTWHKQEFITKSQYSDNNMIEDETEPPNSNWICQNIFMACMQCTTIRNNKPKIRIGSNDPFFLKHTCVARYNWFKIIHWWHCLLRSSW